MMTGYYLRTALIGLLATSGLLCASAATQAKGREGAMHHGPPPRIEERLVDRASRRPDDEIDLILMYTHSPGASQREAVGRAGGRVRREFNLFPALAASVPGRALQGLANNPNVYWISEDAVVGASMDVARTIASHPEGAAALAGYRGGGVTVAVLDSGYSNHPETSVIAAVDILAGIDPADGNGHGSHIAGIIAGSGGRSSGAYQGIAPDASLVSVKVLDGEGKGFASDVIAGIEWVIQNKEAHGIQVLNVSLGTPVTQPAAVDPLVLAVEAAWDAGIVVVCSAGNNGLSGYGTITSPGNSSKVITVGSLTDWNDLDPLTHRVSSFSSRGPTIGDHFMKPDLLAPGNRLVSTRADGSSLDVDMPERRKSAPGVNAVEHFELSGTSMAAAVVSGAAALMLGAEISETPLDRVRETVLVEANSRITYLANSVDPGLGSAWRQLGFDDSGWPVGRYGLGYERGDASQRLHRTFVPRGTRSAYTRATFSIDNPSQVENLFFGADFDDAIVAWVNGQEIYRSSNLASGEPDWDENIGDGHESSNDASPDYGQLTDVSSALPYLVSGDNVLTVAVYNDGSGSSDLVLVPRLVMNRQPVMRYRVNDSDPGLGLSWTSTSFDDSSWSGGSYGVGYDTSGNAQALLTTQVASGGALDLHARRLYGP